MGSRSAAKTFSGGALNVYLAVSFIKGSRTKAGKDLPASWTTSCAAGRQLQCPLRLDTRKVRPELCGSVDVRKGIDSVCRLLRCRRDRRRGKFQSVKRR